MTRYLYYPQQVSIYYIITTLARGLSNLGMPALILRRDRIAGKGADVFLLVFLRCSLRRSAQLCAAQSDFFS
jgi:hypothetical protein